MLTLDDFIKRWNGKPIDFDGVYPNQCMDLAHQYIYEILTIPDFSVLARPSAYQVFTNFTETQYFDKITNTPTNIAQKGDIVVFGQTVGPHGHISIVVSADKNDVTSFDANWPTGSLPKLVVHKNYNGVLGWLRPKVMPIGNVYTDQTKIPAKLLGTSDEMEIQAIRGKLQDLKTVQEQLKGVQTKLEQIKKIAG